MPKQASKSKSKRQYEDQGIIEGIKESRAEMLAGKGIILHSLADLD